MNLLPAQHVAAIRLRSVGAVQGRGLAVARAGWFALAGLIVCLFALGIPDALQRLQQVCAVATCDATVLTPDKVQALESAGLAPSQYAAYLVAVETVLALVYAGVAGLLVFRRATDRMALFAAFTLLTFGAATFVDIIASLAETHPVVEAPAFVLHVAGAACFTVFVFVFPDGRFLPHWTRWVALPWVLVQVPNRLIPQASDLREPYLAIASPFFLVGICSAVFAQVYRYRRVSSAVQRQQTKWTVFGFAVALGGYLGLGVLASVLPSSGSDPLASLAFFTGQSICMILLPLSIGVAVLRHRLYAIDLLINRTVVYSLVTGVLVVAYLAVSMFTQRLLEVVTGDRSGVLANSAGLAVAFGFQPLGRRIKHLVDRVLPPREEVALLFTDIVGSTEKAAAWGDGKWREALERYRTAVRRELKRFGGREVDTAGDGFFVTFSTPLPAVRCAQAIALATRGLGLPSRLGVHFGGCEVRGEKLTGLNVHTAARVMSLARADEVVVSESVREALAGAEVHFDDRGPHVLKGVPGEWRVYAVGLPQARSS